MKAKTRRTLGVLCLLAACLLLSGLFLLQLTDSMQFDLYSGRVRTCRSLTGFKYRTAIVQSDLADAYLNFVGPFPAEEKWVNVASVGGPFLGLMRFNDHPHYHSVLKSAQTVAELANSLQPQGYTPPLPACRITRDASRKLILEYLRTLRQGGSDECGDRYLALFWLSLPETQVPLGAELVPTTEDVLSENRTR